MENDRSAGKGRRVLVASSGAIRFYGDRTSHPLTLLARSDPRTIRSGLIVPEQK